MCAVCVSREQYNHDAIALTDRIVTSVASVEPGLSRAAILHAVESLAGTRCRRAHLTLMTEVVQPAQSTKLPPIAARLVIALRTAGATTLPWPLCQCCGAAVDEHATVGGKVACSQCSRHVCGACGQRLCPPGQLSCSRCAKDRQAARRNGWDPPPPRGTCVDCAHPDQRLDPDGRCNACRQRVARRCELCDAPPPHTFVDGRRLCLHCAVLHRVDDMLGRAGAEGPLTSIRSAILAAANPRTTLNWFGRSRAPDVLADLSAGRTPLTHEGLDALGPNRAVEHLRGLLVASGALPSLSRPVARLEAVSSQLLAAMDHPDRQMLAAWVRWSLMPGVRQRTEAGADPGISAQNGRRALHAVLQFVGGLHEVGRGLGSCRQADMDIWFAGDGAARWDVRSFLAWCRLRSHLPPLALPPPRRAGLSPPLDSEQRWAIARRLVGDDTLDVVDRVAGALLVLYGQPLVRIVGLTVTDVHRAGDRVSVVLGKACFELHEPFGALILQLPIRRRRGVGDQFQSPWLFPGGRPGGHLEHASLAERLRRVGIRPREMRNAARAQLAAEIPPAMLAHILGINAQTAVAWAAVSGGDWMTYAASRQP